MSRVERVAEALRKEISNIIHDELKDPRIGFVTVTRIEVTHDLRYAKIFFSVLGTEKEESDTNEALASGVGFIRRLIAQRIKLRLVPEIRFIQDKSSEYSVHIMQELEKIKELYGKPKKTRKRDKEK
jgi:ribosome-binding factor A